MKSAQRGSDGGGTAAHRRPPRALERLWRRLRRAFRNEPGFRFPAYDALVDPIVVIDERGAIVHANPSIYAVVGWRPEQLVGQNVRVLVPESEASHHDDHLRRYLETDVPRVLGRPREVMALHRDGNPVPVQLTVTETDSDRGRLFVGTLEDLRERRRNETELVQAHQSARREARANRMLAEEEKLLATLRRIGFDHRPLPDLLDEALGEILRASWLRVEARGGIFVSEPETESLELVAQAGLDDPLLTLCAWVPFGTCLCGRAALLRRIQHARCVDERHETRYEGMADHGHYSVPLIWREHVLGVLVLYLPAGCGSDERELRALEKVAAVLSEIIERKRFEAELERERQRALEASRAKGRFLATMSRDFRTPVQGVIGSAEALLATELAPDQSGHARQIQRSAEALLTLIDDILDYSGLQAGRIKLERIDFDLRAVVDDVAQSLACAAREKGVELVLEVRYGAPVALTGDPARLGQVLANLVANAIQFTSAGEVVLSVERVSGAGRIAQLGFAVRDTGIGIAEERLAAIFEPFTQDDGASERPAGGSGLGLAIVRALCERMGGSVDVESVEGQGSTFRVQLPFVKQPALQQSESISRGDLSGLRVLVADPGHSSRRVLVHYCQTWKMGVAIAAEAGELGEQLAKAEQRGEPFDLVLMDSRLAGAGLERVRELRGRSGHPPLILLDRDAIAPEAAAAAGCAQVVPKPLRRSLLFDLIAGTLGRAGSGAGAESAAPTPPEGG